MIWGYGSAGRALRSQCRGRGFESPYLHQIVLIQTLVKDTVEKVSELCVADLFVFEFEAIVITRSIIRSYNYLNLLHQTQSLEIMSKLALK